MKALALVACLAAGVVAQDPESRPTGLKEASKILTQEAARLLKPKLSADDAAKCLYQLTLAARGVVEDQLKRGDMNEVIAALMKVVGKDKLPDWTKKPAPVIVARQLVIRQVVGYLDQLVDYRRMEARLVKLENTLKAELRGEALPTKQDLADLALEISHRSKQLADTRQRIALRHKATLAKRYVEEEAIAGKLSETQILRNLDYYRRESELPSRSRSQRASSLKKAEKWERITKLKGLDVPKWQKRTWRHLRR